MSEILQQLGLNVTLFFQAGLFVVTVLVLRFVVYGPYMAANEERVKRTTGSEETAQNIQSQLETLEEQFAVKAKDLNENVSQIFAKQKSMASAEAERMVSEARTKASSTTDTIKKSIREEAERAKNQIPVESKNLAALMVQKLLGKGASF